MRLAVWQCAPFATDPDAAIAGLDEAAARAAAGGADLLVAPEMLISGYAIGAEAAARLACPRGGDYHERVGRIARDRGIALAFGYPEATAEGTRNAATVIDATGAPVLDYAKAHLWGEMDRRQFIAGGELSDVAEIAGWRVSLAICFDIEFPEVARGLALAGADLILVPTACAEPWRSVPQRQIPVRAEENGLFVAYANYVGREGDLAYCGHSCVASPDGEDLARAGLDQALIFADLDKAAIGRCRRAIPYLEARRGEMYGALVRPRGD